METELATAPVDMDAIAAEYRIAAILNDRTTYFEKNTPPSYRDFNPQHPDALRNATAVERVLNWKYNDKGLLLSGRTHRCKTRAAFALCKRLLIEELRDVGIWHMQAFFTELQSNFRYGRDEAGDFIKRQSERPVLFLDDYGQEALMTNKQEWAQGWLFTLVDLRIRAGLPLILTTNLTANHLTTDGNDPHSDPFVSRLLDVCEPVKFQ